MSESLPKPNRRRFQFSLRTLLAVQLVVAGLLSVAAYRIDRERTAVAELTALGWRVETETRNPNWFWNAFPEGLGSTATKVQGPPDPLPMQPCLFRPVAEEALPRLKRLPNLRTLELLTISPPFEKDMNGVVAYLERSLPTASVEHWMWGDRELTESERRAFATPRRRRLLEQSRLLEETRRADNALDQSNKQEAGLP